MVNKNKMYNNMTRIGYMQLRDDQWMSVIDFDAIMDDGFVFLWVVNAKYTDAIVFMDSRGFKMIEQVNWLKINSKG